MPSNVTPKRPRGRPPKPKPVLDWRDRLKLGPGETLRESRREMKGTLGQNDVEEHDVVDAQGQKTGTVVYRSMTLLRPPFRTTYTLVQADTEGKVMLKVRWSA